MGMMIKIQILRLLKVWMSALEQCNGTEQLRLSKMSAIGFAYTNPDFLTGESFRSLVHWDYKIACESGGKVLFLP